MRLTSFEYAQYEGQPLQWRVQGLLLRDVTLLVGKNASGKSRTLNVIHGLAQLLSGNTKLAYSTGHFTATFDDGGKTVKYQLHFEDRKVIREQFTIAGVDRLVRGPKGAGEIFAEKEERNLEFQAPEDELAIVSRQDSIQHSFSQPLIAWAKSLFYYPFGTPLGKDRLVVIVKDPNTPFDAHDPTNVAAIFHRGITEYGDRFKNAVKADMKSIGYSLDDIGLDPPRSLSLSPTPLGAPVGLFVKEADLADVTDHFDMSQGMFRALSVIVQTTYSAMALNPGCVLIDDIGEGLDFERSFALIRTIVDKAARSSVQLIMSTNDRFVMNAVPLESWSVLRRSGQDSRVYNYTNSKEKFDNFKFTGMNNFDFLATDFLGDGDHDK